MTESEPKKKEPEKDLPLMPPGEDQNPFGLFGGSSPNRLQRRRQKIREEIARNRRGEYKIPTWVLALALVLFLAAWAAWIFFGSSG